MTEDDVIESSVQVNPLCVDAHGNMFVLLKVKGQELGVFSAARPVAQALDFLWR